MEELKTIKKYKSLTHYRGKPQFYIDVNKIPQIEGYVYFIRMGETNFYKIGISKYVEKRIKQIQDQLPNNVKAIKIIKTLYSSFIESCLHDIFKSKKTRGEWFEFSECDVLEVISILDHVNIKNDYERKIAKYAPNGHERVKLGKKYLHAVYVSWALECYPNKVEGVHYVYSQTQKKRIYL
jgi:hypothetical protein